jgi:hypothetical protein
MVVYGTEDRASNTQKTVKVKVKDATSEACTAKVIIIRPKCTVFLALLHVHGFTLECSCSLLPTRVEARIVSSPLNLLFFLFSHALKQSAKVVDRAEGAHSGIHT